MKLTSDVSRFKMVNVKYCGTQRKQPEKGCFFVSFFRVVSESNCTEKKIADSVYQIWRKSGQRNSVPDIVAEFINRGHDFKTSLMAGF